MFHTVYDLAGLSASPFNLTVSGLSVSSRTSLAAYVLSAETTICYRNLQHVVVESRYPRVGNTVPLLAGITAHARHEDMLQA